MTGSRLRVLLLTDFEGWHEAELRAAFDARAVDLITLSLRHCGFASDAGPHGVCLPGVRYGLPAAALVRFVPGGSFEQVTLCLSVLHALSALGVLVYNDARVIERTVDKAMTGFLLARAGIASPPAWVLRSRRRAVDRLRRELDAGHRLVLKPLFGARGNGLRLLGSLDELPPDDAPEVSGVYYLQRYVATADGDDAGRDWRVLVIGGRAVAAMERRASHWITNRARGARCLPAEPVPALMRLAERAANAVGAAYAGVDLLHPRDAGHETRQGGGLPGYQVIEVNGVPAWQGLQSVTPLPLAGRLADDLLRRLAGRAGGEPPRPVGDFG